MIFRNPNQEIIEFIGESMQVNWYTSTPLTQNISFWLEVGWNKHLNYEKIWGIRFRFCLCEQKNELLLNTCNEFFW